MIRFSYSHLVYMFISLIIVLNLGPLNGGLAVVIPKARMDTNPTPKAEITTSVAITDNSAIPIYSLSWSPRADMPTRRYSAGVAASNDGQIYVVGGDNYSNLPLSTTEEYDTATNIWSTRQSMPTRRWALGAVVTSNGKLYAIGGQNCGDVSCFGGSLHYLSTVEEFDPSTNTWTTRQEMPTPRSDFGIALARNGRIYAIGGSNNSGTLAIVEEYNPATNSWARRRSMPSPKSGLGVVSGLDGKLYAIGGTGSNSVYEYDPQADIWVVLGLMPAWRIWSGVSAANNNRIYQIGGESNGYTDTVQEYDPAANVWSSQTSMPAARRGLSAVLAIDGNIYAIGGWGPGGTGYGGSGPLGTVEAATISCQCRGEMSPVLQVEGMVTPPSSVYVRY